MYAYYCTQRPPMLGAIPRDVQDIEDIEHMVEDLGGHLIYAYARIWYDRELTDEEISDYELNPAE